MRLLNRALPQLRSAATSPTSSSSSSSSSSKGGAAVAALRSILSDNQPQPRKSQHHQQHLLQHNNRPLKFTASLDPSHINNKELQPQFSHRSLWPRGTWDDPVPITSTAHERVVACTGVSPRGNNTSLHPTRWLTVRVGRPSQCPDCGQVFKLEQRVGEDDADRQNIHESSEHEQAVDPVGDDTLATVNADVNIGGFTAKKGKINHST